MPKSCCLANKITNPDLGFNWIPKWSQKDANAVLKLLTDRRSPWLPNTAPMDAADFWCQICQKSSFIRLLYTVDSGSTSVAS